MIRYRHVWARFLTIILVLGMAVPFSPFDVKAGTLPLYWNSAIVKCSVAACPSLANYDAAYANQTFTVRTSNGKLQNEGDTMYAAYTSITGDFTFTAKINSFKNQPSGTTDTTGAGALSYQNKALLFVKKNIDSADPSASSAAPGLSLVFQPKQVTDNKNSNYVYVWQNHVTSTTTASNVATAIKETTPLAGYPITMSDLSTSPLYLKWQKTTDAVTKNSTFSGYISKDGLHYGNGTTEGTPLYVYTDVNQAIFGAGALSIGLGVDYGTVDFTEVTIMDAYGNKVFPSSASASTPTGVFTVAGNTKASVGWTAVTGAVQYQVKRSTVSGGPYETVGQPTTTSFTDSNLTNGITYYYVVSAVTGDGESPNSLPVNVTPVYTPDPPAAPTGLQGVPADSQIRLQWGSVQGADSYNLLRSSDGGTTYSNAALSLTNTSFTDAGLHNGTDYRYVVQARNVGGTSVNSAPLTIFPVAPQAGAADLKAIPRDNRVDLSWQALSGTVSYRVKRATAAAGPYTTLVSDLSTADYSDLTAVNGTMYFYVVTAQSAQSESMNSAAVSVTPMSGFASATAIPTGVQVSPGDSEVSLSWSTVSGAASYKVKRAASLTGPFTLLGLASTPAYIDNTAANGSKYFYTVSAMDANGESAPSSIVIGTPAKIIVVAQDGTGDYPNVQSAINAIPANNAVRTVIFIKNGVYTEKITVNKPFVSLVGENKDATILTYDDYACKPAATSVVVNPTASASSCSGLPAGTNVLGTSLSASVLVSAANVTAENVTIRNTAYPRTVVAPAVALYVTGDKAIFRNLKVLGFQDTVYVNSGREYYSNVLIEGDVDFIFGNATAVFDHSEMKFVGNAGGHTTAASTDQTNSYGYVFSDSKLTRGTSSLKNAVTVGSWDASWDTDANPALMDGKVDLGRPWRPYANVKYINTWMDAHIKAVGWDNWGDAANESTALFGEYNSSGPGSNPSGRYGWSKQLTASEANALTATQVLKGTDGWDPTQFGALPTELPRPKLAAPAGASAALGASQVRLIWQTVQGALSYHVYRSTSADGPYALIGDGLTAVSYTDTAAALGTTYYYKVAAVNETGEGSLSTAIPLATGGSFDKNPSNQTNVTAVIQIAGDSLSGIYNGATALVQAVDYSVSGNQITFNKSYLARMPVGSMRLNIQLAAGGRVTFPITVTNTTALPSQTIANVPALNLYTVAGVAPYLPTIVPVNYTDQTTAAVPVVWESLQAAQYAEPGTFTIRGVVAGTNLPAAATMTVQSPNAVGYVTGGADAQSYLTHVPFQMPQLTVAEFPNRDFNIQQYGAVGDGQTSNTAAFASAIAAAVSSGGGRVIVPSGIWLTSQIQLKSNVNLHLENGAKIVFDPTYSDYFNGSGSRYKSFLSGTGLTNAAITGQGTIDGNGQYWRYLKKSKLSASQWNYLMSLGGVVSEDGTLWYPSQEAVGVNRPLMIDINTSKNVLIDGPTIVNSPQFATSITNCQNVVIRNTTVNNDWWAQNGDGLDVTSSQTVLMYHNTVYAGDDAIGMKSSNDPIDSNMLSNVVIADNIVFRGHGGLSIGSNTSGGIRNMAVLNNQYIGTDNGLNFKSYVGGGGFVDHIYVDGVHMQNIVDTAIQIDAYYKGHDAVLDNAKLGIDYRVPEFKNIQIRHVTVDGADQAVAIDVLPNVPLHEMELSDVTIRAKKGWTSTNTTGIQLTNVKIIPDAGTLFTLSNSRNYVIKQVLSPPGISTFLHLAGYASGIQLVNTDVSALAFPFLLDQGISQSAITVSNEGLPQLPSAPTDVIAVSGQSAVNVSWNTVSEAVYYSVKRSTASGGNYKIVATNLTSAAYQDLNVSEGGTYYYVVTASNTAGESSSSHEASASISDSAPSPLQANLWGPSFVAPGQTFSLNYGLSSVLGSVYAAVYSQALTFQFDPGLLEFVSAEPLQSGQVIGSVTAASPGLIQIVLLDQSLNPFLSESMLKLTFKAKALEQSGGNRMSVSLRSGILLDGLGRESRLIGIAYSATLQPDAALLDSLIARAQSLDSGHYSSSSWSALQTSLQSAIAIRSNVNTTQVQLHTAANYLQSAIDALQPLADKGALKLSIAEAQSKKASATVGSRWGQYPQLAINVLTEAIAKAVAMDQSESATQAAVDRAVFALQAERLAFQSSMNTKASVSDLAIVSAHYGSSAGSQNWRLLQRYDSNEDGKLDMIDLSAIAKQMLTR